MGEVAIETELGDRAWIERGGLVGSPTAVGSITVQVHLLQIKPLGGVKIEIEDRRDRTWNKCGGDRANHWHGPDLSALDQRSGQVNEE